MRLIDAEKLHREVKEHCKKLIDEGVKEVDVVDIAAEIGKLVMDAQTEFAEEEMEETALGANIVPCQTRKMSARKRGEHTGLNLRMEH